MGIAHRRTGAFGSGSAKTYFEAYGIDVELFQEAVGHHIYPVTVNGLGRVQLFVSKEQAKEAYQLLDKYQNARE
jgi:hypothetical protein